MSIEDRLQVVKLAEIELKTHSDRASRSLRDLKSSYRDLATPFRIVSVGAIAGFVSGRGSSKNSGGGLGAKLLTTIAQALITTLGAGATAGVAAGAAADAASVATSDAIKDDSVAPTARIAAARQR